MGYYSMISIIVPVYNVEKVLHNCVESILSQTFSDFELILVDDGSPDNSGKICDEYAAKNNRIQVIHKANGGVSTARNAGIEKAKGEYICFVDSDDYLEKDYLNTLIEAKRKHPDFDNVWCGFQTVEDYNRKNKEIVVSEKDKKASLSDIGCIMDLCGKWLVQMPWNKLFVTKIIRKNSLNFPPELSLGEDYIFNLQYLDCTNGKIVVVNKPEYNYLRDGKESLDNKYYPNLLEIYRRLNTETERYAEKWNLSEEQRSKMYSSFFFRLEAVLRNTFSESNKASKREKCCYNSKIVKSADFQMSLNKMNASIHPLYRFAYKSKSYSLIRAVEMLIKCRTVLIKKLQKI